MKKLFGILLIALFLVPVCAKAKTSIDEIKAESDANGVFTSKIVIKVDSGDVINDIPQINLQAQHAIIQSVTAVDTWKKDETISVLNGGLDGVLKVTKDDLATTGYTGTGENEVIAEIKYVHDTSYQGTEECMVKIGFAGDTTKKITEKTTTNAPTGSFLPYAGIAAGTLLIAAAFVISRKSTKLYKI